ncbi:MAG: CarD family transcriptional regulator [Oscillospiraceae bacterium]|nr:CarD family transcriptional regulator [Oscillospiraceae bacterium]
MYQIGDLILYGNTGVCRVSDIFVRKSSCSDEGQLCYTLSPLYQDCMISTPVDSTKVFMRPIISRKEAEELIDSIPSIRASAYHNRVLRQLAEHYEEAIKSHDCQDLVRLTTSLYDKKREVASEKKKFGAVDERFMKRAEDLLFGELGAALGIPRDKVPDYISSRIEKNGSEHSVS